MIAQHSRTSLVLNYGVDAISCPSNEIKISELGLSFFSHWNFIVGTEMSISLSQNPHTHPSAKITVSVLVVRSEPLPDHHHATTLLFLDLPDSIRPQLRAFSHTLAAA
jgi:hypothetical protein